MGPDVLYSESSGNLAGGRDGTAKSRPSSSGLKTDGLDGWEHCINYMAKGCHHSKDGQYKYCSLGSTASYNVRLDIICVLAQVMGGHEKKKGIECIHYIREGNKRVKIHIHNSDPCP